MKLCEMGMRVSPTSDGLWARAAGRLRAVDIATLPHPGFATDFMPIAVALMYGGRRQRDRHREHLRRPLPVRRRARRAWAPTCAPRAATRSSAASIGCRARRCTASDVRAGRRARARRPRGRRRDDRARLRARRPGLRRPARDQLRSLGADVERLRSWSGSRRSGAARGTRREYWSGVWEHRDTGAFTSRSAQPGARMSLDLASMEEGILEAIDAIRPALQSDGGDIVYQRHRRRRRRARVARRRVRHAARCRR